MPYPYPLVFSTLGTPDWSLKRCAEQAVADGYAGLEVRILDGQVISPHLPAERRAAIRSLLKRHGLVIAGIGASTRFSSPDAEDRAQHLADLRAYLALANDLEAPIVRTFGGGPSEGQTMAEVIDLVADSLAEAAPDAEREGVTICLETHDAFCRGEEVAGGAAPGGFAVCQGGLGRASPLPDGGVSRGIPGTSSARGWPTWHMKDAQRRADGSWELKLMGEGEVPCRKILDLIAARGIQRLYLRRVGEEVVPRDRGAGDCAAAACRGCCASGWRGKRTGDKDCWHFPRGKQNARGKVNCSIVHLSLWSSFGAHVSILSLRHQLSRVDSVCRQKPASATVFLRQRLNSLSASGRLPRYEEQSRTRDTSYRNLAGSAPAYPDLAQLRDESRCLPTMWARLFPV